MRDRDATGDMIVSTLKQEGVPQDLIYLAQAESVSIHSPCRGVGARGIWQFMGSRAEGTALSHNMWVDDGRIRKNPPRRRAPSERSYNQFGDWYLAWLLTIPVQARCRPR